jgi:hypothetical protein
LIFRNSPGPAHEIFNKTGPFEKKIGEKSAEKSGVSVISILYNGVIFMCQPWKRPSELVDKLPDRPGWTRKKAPAG